MKTTIKIVTETEISVSCNRHSKPRFYLISFRNQNQCHHNFQLIFLTFYREIEQRTLTFKIL